MASLLKAELPSDDEADDDYDPTADKTAEKGDINTKVVSGSKAKRKRGALGTASDDNDVVDDDQDEPMDLATLAKRKKAQLAWQALQQPSSSAGKSTPGLGSLNVASLCRPVNKVAKQKSDELWMQQLGLATSKQAKNQSSKVLKDAAAKALQLAKDGAAAAEKQGKVTITETRRFAGQNIKVNKVVAAGSDQAQKAADTTAKSGLDAVLESLEAAKKVNVLDKSRHDWTDFKRENTEVEEELEGYKKSNDKYLDKVDFLQRADVRQYEKERDTRLASDIRTRGRT